MYFDDPLALYRLMFKRIIAESLPTRVNNNSPDHAAVLIDELIRSAKDSVVIYCRAMTADVWGRPNVVSAILRAMNARVRFRIVTQQKPEDTESFRLLDQYERAEFRLYAQEGLNMNFVLVDGKRFRVEPDSNERHGYAYANNPEEAACREQEFEDIWYLASRLKPVV